jgi:arylsulfate sulfotransferase
MAPWRSYQAVAPVPILVAFVLTSGANTLPPIGQHALSITNDNNLLLFDNGKSSLNHTPTGADRTYSGPRMYQLNLQSKVATGKWNYPNNQALYGPYCSSIYEDAALNYLVDYAIITNLGASQFFEILSAKELVVFSYSFRFV